MPRLQENKIRILKEGIKDGLSIMLGYLSVSFAYGILTASEMAWYYPIIISATNLTGTGQFVGTQLLVAGATILEIGLTVFIINIRYVLMSISLSQKLDKSVSLKQRLVIAFGNTDEVYAVAMSKEKPTFAYMMGLIGVSYIGWVLGTTLGAVAGDVIPSDLRSAMAIALFAMYIAIITPPIKGDNFIFFIIATAAATSCALRLIPIFGALPSGYIITISGVFAALVWSVIKVKLKKRNKQPKSEEWAPRFSELLNKNGKAIK